MRFEIEAFERYFESASETERELLESDSSLVAGIRTYHGFLAEHVFGDQEWLSPIQALLGMHGFMTHLSAVRVALSGHVAATFPLLRAVLEASCYALLIGGDESLEDVWLERNTTAVALRTCRRKFNSAVKMAARDVQTRDWVSAGTEEWINEAYDAAIDYGAHPNPKAVWPYVYLGKDRPDGYVGVGLTSLYGARAHGTSRGLIACLDYRLLMAVILTSCVDSPPREALLGIVELNELKEALVRRCFE